MTDETAVDRKKVMVGQQAVDVTDPLSMMPVFCDLITSFGWWVVSSPSLLRVTSLMVTAPRRPASAHVCAFLWRLPAISKV